MRPPGWASTIEKTSLVMIGTVLLLVVLEEKFGWDVPGFGPALLMFGAGDDFAGQLGQRLPVATMPRIRTQGTPVTVVDPPVRWAAASPSLQLHPRHRGGDQPDDP